VENFIFERETMMMRFHDINKAVRLYEDLGAFAKAEQLKEKHGKLLGPPSEIKTWLSEPDDLDDQSSGNQSGGPSRKVEFK
jgi:hypothetical protein